MSHEELIRKYEISTTFKANSKGEVREFLKDFILAEGVDEDMFKIEEVDES